jgi:DUF4097 and DUF4098 domain-containing protein YvlB
MSMASSIRSVAAAAFLALGAVAATGQTLERQSVERFRSAVALAPNGSLLVDNPIGQVQIVGTARPGLRWETVKVVRGVADADVQDGRELTRLWLDGVANARVLRTIVGYPLRNGRWESTVAYRIEVPYATNVTVVNISTPAIQISRISGAVTVKNVSGRVELYGLTGKVQVESVNGVVRAILPETVINASRFSSVNGRVELAAPPSASFNWTAETARGGVHASFQAGGFFREQDDTRRYYASINGNKGPTIVTSSVLGDVYLLRPEQTVANASIIAAPAGRNTSPPASRPMPLQPEAQIAYQRITRTLLMQMPTARSFAAQQAHIAGDYRVDAPVGSIFVGQIDGDANVATRAGEIVIGRVAGKGDLRSLGGSLHLGDVDGPITAHTSVGDIFIRSAKKGGTVVTDAGVIRIGRSAGRIELRSGGGDILLHRAEGPVEARTRSGDVFLAVAPSLSRLRIDAATEDGNLTLQIPAGFGADIDATVITSSDGVEVIKTELRGLTIVRDTVGGRTRIRATGSINGGGEKVMLNATEGTIQIRTAGAAR